MTPSENNRTSRPLVSVVLATYNEARHIQACMDSLRAQNTPDFALEILAVDGMSTDGTRKFLEKVAAEDSRVRVFSNEHRRAPFAFNIGIREARGEYVCIFGSHTIYAKDYISVCFEELRAKNAGGCGGRVFVVPASDKLEARVVAYAFAHPFGSSRKSFRTQPEGYVDTIGYMILRKDVLAQVSGYSESLLRNQDNDTNQKIRSLGHRLYCTWKTHCFYRTKATVRELLAYAYKNGFWNVISLKENPSSMGARHFIPFFFVVALISTFLFSAIGELIPAKPALLFALPLLGILALHLGAGTFVALKVTISKKDLGALLLPPVFIAFHTAYGMGTLIGFLTGARAQQTSSPVAGTSQHVRSNESAEALPGESI